jgi:hypothetical protein
MNSIPCSYFETCGICHGAGFCEHMAKNPWTPQTHEGDVARLCDDAYHAVDEVKLAPGALPRLILYRSRVFEYYPVARVVGNDERTTRHLYREVPSLLVVPEVR